MKNILTVLVGSHAHGLAGPNSDRDIRGVFISPTEDFFKVDGSPVKMTNWIEGDQDDTSWEVGHFLKLATKCNPTILEVFHAPIEASTQSGMEMRGLFPYLWDPILVRNAFIGYGLNQRKKFLDDKDKRANKYAVAYLRVLLQAYHLLRDGKFVIDFTNNIYKHTLMEWKNGNYTVGEVVNLTIQFQKQVDYWASVSTQKPDLSHVNRFLLKLRKDNLIIPE